MQPCPPCLSLGGPHGLGSPAALLPDQEDTPSSMSLFPTRDVAEGDKR